MENKRAEGIDLEKKNYPTERVKLGIKSSNDVQLFKRIRIMPSVTNANIQSKKGTLDDRVSRDACSRDFKRKTT